MTPEQVEQRLREIEERVNAASPGPWVTYQAVVDCGGKEDADFIAHARDDIPWLLSLIRELDAENRRLRERVEYLESGIRALIEEMGGD